MALVPKDVCVERVNDTSEPNLSLLGLVSDTLPELK